MRLWMIALGALALTCATSIATGIAFNRQETQEQSSSLNSTRLTRCLQAARERQRPYAIESAVVIWSFSDTQTRRYLSVRIVYTLRVLRPFSAQEAGLFKEEYGYDTRLFRHWHGPEDERWLSAEGHVYAVEFDGEEGEIRTVVTGAELEYPLPFAEGRAGFGNRISLKANEDFWRYPNEVDVICSITLILQSATTSIAPVGLGGALARGSEVTPRAAVNRALGEARQHSLSVRWEETLLPGDIVGIHFSW